MSKHCAVCGTEIPEGRLKAVPSTKTCVQHSTTSKFGVNIVQHGSFDDDCYQEVQIIRDERAMEKLIEYKQQVGKFL